MMPFVIRIERRRKNRKRKNEQIGEKINGRVKKIDQERVKRRPSFLYIPCVLLTPVMMIGIGEACKKNEEKEKENLVD